MNLKIVPLQEIPKGLDCSCDHLPELYKLGLLMEVICEKEKGIGLSAVQVGVPLNFFIAKFSNSYRYFVNCKYMPISENKERCVEGCLSIKKANGEFRHFEVDRFKNVKVQGKELLVDPILELVDFEFTPIEMLDAAVFQHEIDHASLITIDQIGKEVFVWLK